LKDKNQSKCGTTIAEVIVNNAVKEDENNDSNLEDMFVKKFFFNYKNYYRAVVNKEMSFAIEDNDFKKLTELWRIVAQKFEISEINSWLRVKEYQDLFTFHSDNILDELDFKKEILNIIVEHHKMINKNTKDDSYFNKDLDDICVSLLFIYKSIRKVYCNFYSSAQVNSFVRDNFRIKKRDIIRIFADKNKRDRMDFIKKAVKEYITLDTSESLVDNNHSKCTYIGIDPVSNPELADILDWCDIIFKRENAYYDLDNENDIEKLIKKATEQHNKEFYH